MSNFTDDGTENPSGPSLPVATPNPAHQAASNLIGAPKALQERTSPGEHCRHNSTELTDGAKVILDCNDLTNRSSGVVEEEMDSFEKNQTEAQRVQRLERDMLRDSDTLRPSCDDMAREGRDVSDNTSSIRSETFEEDMVIRKTLEDLQTFGDQLMNALAVGIHNLHDCQLKLEAIVKKSQDDEIEKHLYGLHLVLIGLCCFAFGQVIPGIWLVNDDHSWRGNLRWFIAELEIWDFKASSLHRGAFYAPLVPRGLCKPTSDLRKGLPFAITWIVVMTILQRRHRRRDDQGQGGLGELWEEWTGTGRGRLVFLLNVFSRIYESCALFVYVSTIRSSISLGNIPMVLQLIAAVVIVMLLCIIVNHWREVLRMWQSC